MTVLILHVVELFLNSSENINLKKKKTDRALASSRLCLSYVSATHRLRIGYTSTTPHLRLDYDLASISCEHCRSSRNNPHCAPRHVIYYRNQTLNIPLFNIKMILFLATKFGILGAWRYSSRLSSAVLRND